MSKQQGGNQTVLKYSHMCSHSFIVLVFFHVLPLHPHSQSSRLKLLFSPDKAFFVCCFKANTNPKPKSYMCNSLLISDSSVNVCEQLSQIAGNHIPEAAACNVKQKLPRMKPDFVQNTIFIQAFTSNSALYVIVLAVVKQKMCSYP